MTRPGDLLALLARWIARYLLRIAQQLDPTSTTKPAFAGTVPPAHAPDLAALADRFPGAPVHWLALVAEVADQFEGTSPVAADAPTGTADMTSSAAADGRDPRTDPAVPGRHQGHRFFSLIGAKPERRLPTPSANSRRSARGLWSRLGAGDFVPRRIPPTTGSASAWAARVLLFPKLRAAQPRPVSANPAAIPPRPTFGISTEEKTRSPVAPDQPIARGSAPRALSAPRSTLESTPQRDRHASIATAPPHIRARADFAWLGSAAARGLPEATFPVLPVSRQPAEMAAHLIGLDAPWPALPVSALAIADAVPEPRAAADCRHEQTVGLWSA